MPLVNCAECNEKVYFGLFKCKACRKSLCPSCGQKHYGHDDSADATLNQEEFQSLVRFMKIAPGRLTAVIVPGPLVGQKVIEQIEAELQLPITIASETAYPGEIGHLALEMQEKDSILIIRLDGSRKFPGEWTLKNFIENLNFQREALAGGNLRTCIIMNDEANNLLLYHSDDLMDWCRIYRLT